MRKLDEGPQLRAFFSADLVGSTKLKNRLNHQELYDKYRARMSVVDRLRLPDAEAAKTAVLESLSVSTEDVDWAKVVAGFYRDLHNEFAANLSQIKERHGIGDIDRHLVPWKAIGDELIYQFRVFSRKHLHWLTVAFLCALRTIDHKLGTRAGPEQGLRIKGSAWVAGFPVRNRIIELPMLRSAAQTTSVEDFLGPDIDTGFRIGKCTRPGMLVVSSELAELLSEAPGDMNPILGKIVGWELLNGVWDDRRYPVVWIDLPSGYPGSRAELAAQDFDQWQHLECSWCRTWGSENPARAPLRDIAAELRDVRAKLPKSLGLVDPYIAGDPDTPDELPEEHRRIRELLEMVRAHQDRVLKQDADDSGERDERAGERLDELLEDAGERKQASGRAG